MPELKQCGDMAIVPLLVGNKTDLPRQVTEAEVTPPITSALRTPTDPGPF